MNSYAWVGMLGIILFTLWPLLNKQKRTREEVKKAIVTIGSVIGIISAVLVFNVNFLVALLLGYLAMILLDSKTYTKKRLIMYGAITLILGIAAYSLLRDNPDYL